MTVFYLAAVYYLVMVGAPLFTASTLDPILLWCWQIPTELLAGDWQAAVDLWTRIRGVSGP